MNTSFDEEKENILTESNNKSENKQQISELNLLKKNIFNILKLLLLIISITLFSFVIFLVGMFFIAPNVNAKIFNFLGIKSAEEACYIQIYKKSNNNADLYNLILFEKQIKNYEKELEYIDLLKEKSDYQEFCKKMDLTGLDFCKGNKNQYIYYVDVNAYFESRRVFCKFYLNINNETDFDILSDLKNNLNKDNLTEYSFYEYINLILTTKNITKEAKIEFVKEIYNNSMISLVLDKINNIEDKIISETDEVDLILLQNSLINHLKSIYYYEVMLNNEETETAITFKNQYKIAYEKYLELVS